MAVRDPLASVQSELELYDGDVTWVSIVATLEDTRFELSLPAESYMQTEIAKVRWSFVVN